MVQLWRSFEKKNTRGIKAGKTAEAVRKYSDTPEKDLKEMGLTVNKPPIAMEFGRIDTKHHQRHIKELGYKNEKEYIKGAIEFFNSNRGELYYSQRRGNFLKFERSTGLISICDLEGTIRTYYKVSLSKFERIKKQEELQ